MTDAQSSTTRSTLLLAVLPAALLIALLGVGTYMLVTDEPPEAASADTPRGVDAAQVTEEIIAAAEQALRNGEPGRAHTLLEQAIERLPNEQSLRLLFAEAKMTMGDPAAAYEQADRAIAIGPDHPEYRHMAAMFADEAGLLEQAEVQYLMAQKLAPADPKYAVFLGVIQHKLGHLTKSKTNMLLGTRIDPSIPEAWAVLAEISLEENRPAVGMQHIRRARQLQPASAPWRVIEARLHRRLNEPERAADVLLGISEFERLRNPAILLELATTFGLLGEPDRAAGLYIDAVQIAPEDAEMHLQAALWLERSGQERRALPYAEEAARLGHEQAAEIVKRLDA